MPPDKTEGLTQCERCLRNVRRRGMGAHNRFCTAKPKDNTEQDMINAIVDRDKQQGNAPSTFSNGYRRIANYHLF